MPTYRTNIVLHHAADDDYVLLDKELKSQHFSREKALPAIEAGNLPALLRTRYLREGNLGLQEVVAEVKRAAAKTGKKFSFTVLKNRN
jgi:hypothetical protein